MAWHKRVLEADPARGMTEYHYFDPDTGAQALQTVWDVKPVVEHAKEFFNAFDTSTGWRGDWHHVGWIPDAIQEDYFRRTGKSMLADQDHVKHWLNDSANAVFRSRPGKV